MKYLITGGCGFLGSNLGSEVMRRSEELCVFDNLSREGSSENRKWLDQFGSFEFVQADIREPGAVVKVIQTFRPDVIFHLAGQVAMTKSLESPRIDFEINSLGSLNVLEAVRTHQSNAAIIYSSTNKLYGDLGWIRLKEDATRYVALDYPSGFNEDMPLEFHSPYGCSKGSADQYMLDYARVYGLRTAVFRHSSMYGGRQFSTYDQGWISWFCQQAYLQEKGKLNKPFSISGNGKQVRDVLHVDDMKRLYLSAAAKIDQIKGQVFNIGGGMENSLSLLELFDLLENLLNVELKFQKLPARISDQKIFIADVTKIQNFLKWAPKINVTDGIKNCLEWITAQH